MEIICPLSKNISNVYNKQNYNNSLKYRKIMYLKELIINDDYLLYNTLTDELILLDKNEYNDFNNENLKDNNFILYQYLIKHWFLVPNDLSEKTMVYLYRNIFCNDNQPLLNKTINSYTILTTTDCNARCYYCFELGTKRINMSKQTAEDVANFIIDNSDHNKQINISWFGGEPLFNSEVIDIISEKLTENGLKYSCGMTSNGYLFDDSLTDKANTLWNLRKVQITLDGTEKNYNKTKAYIYKNDNNPFETVLNNIERLVKSNIYVSIRCNISKYNYLEFYDLIDIIYDRFKDYKNKISMYFFVLFENIENNLIIRTDEERNFLYNELYKLEDYCLKKGLHQPSTMRNISGIKTQHCMADSSNSVMITPEGNLGVCEHYIDSNFFGSIYDNKLDRDYNNLNEWRQKHNEFEQCNTCCYYTKCNRLKKCVPIKSMEYPLCYNKINRKTEVAIKTEYEKFKLNNN